MLEENNCTSNRLFKLANSEGFIPTLRIPTRFDVVIPEKWS
jgi:hypothetical protein